jgi:hypothetical protein
MAAVTDSVSCTAEHVILTLASGLELRRAWDEVWRIYAYRIDAIEREVLYLVLDDSTGHGLELLDDTVGFDAVVARVAALANVAPEMLRARLDALTVDGSILEVYTRRP